MRIFIGGFRLFGLRMGVSFWPGELRGLGAREMPRLFQLYLIAWPFAAFALLAWGGGGRSWVETLRDDTWRQGRNGAAFARCDILEGPL
jgi:hypothetical protein